MDYGHSNSFIKEALHTTSYKSPNFIYYKTNIWTFTISQLITDINVIGKTGLKKYDEILVISLYAILIWAK